MLVVLQSGVLTFALLLRVARLKTKRISAIVIFTLVLISSLRYRVGYDYDVYFDFFLRPQNYQGLFEPGFYYVIFILSDMGFSPFFIFTILAVIIYSIMLLSLNKFGLKSTLFPLVVFIISPGLFANSHSIIRQFIGISFFLLSCSFLVKRSYVLFIFFILIGALFHTSTLVAGLLALISIFIRLQKFTILIFASSVSMLLGFFVTEFLSAIPNFAYFKYIEIVDQLYLLKAGLFLLIALVFRFLFCSEMSTNNNTVIYFNIYAIGVLVLLCFGLFIPFSRLFYYFLPLIAIATASLGLSSLNRKLIIFQSIVFLLLSLASLRAFHIDYRDNQIPNNYNYQTWVFL